MFQRRIDDYWSTEWSRDLPDSWTGLTRFTILDENLQMEFHGLGGGWRSKRYPGLTTCGQSSGKTCQKQRNEKQNKSGLPKTEAWQSWKVAWYLLHWSSGMLEFQVTFKKMREESWKFRCQQQCLAKTKGVKGKLVALLMLARQNTHASLKPTNRRERVWKTLSTKIMKTTLQGKESTHWNTTISCTNWVPCLKARKIPDAKAAVDREWAKLEQIPAWQLTKVRNKKEVIDEARKEGKIFHFASLMDICHLKYSELEPKFQKIQRPSCTPRRHCKRWFRL